MNYCLKYSFSQCVLLFNVMILTKTNYELLDNCTDFLFKFLNSEDNNPNKEQEAAKIPIIKNRTLTVKYSKIGPTTAIENAVVPTTAI